MATKKYPDHPITEEIDLEIASCQRIIEQLTAAIEANLFSDPSMAVGHCEGLMVHVMKVRYLLDVRQKVNEIIFDPIEICSE